MCRLRNFAHFVPCRHGRRLIEDRHPRSCRALPNAPLSKASRLRERTRLDPPLPPGRKRALDHTPITESAVPHCNASRVPWVYHPPAPPAASRRFDLKSPTRRGTAHRGPVKGIPSPSTASVQPPIIQSVLSLSACESRTPCVSRHHALSPGPAAPLSRLLLRVLPPPRISPRSSLFFVLFFLFRPVSLL